MTNRTQDARWTQGTSPNPRSRIQSLTASRGFGIETAQSFVGNQKTGQARHFVRRLRAPRSVHRSREAATLSALLRRLPSFSCVGPHSRPPGFVLKAGEEKRRMAFKRRGCLFSRYNRFGDAVELDSRLASHLTSPGKGVRRATVWPLLTFMSRSAGQRRHRGEARWCPQAASQCAGVC